MEGLIRGLQLNRRSMASTLVLILFVSNIIPLLLHPTEYNVNCWNSQGRTFDLESSLYIGLALIFPSLLDAFFDRIYSSSELSILFEFIPLCEIIFLLFIPNTIFLTFFIPFDQYHGFVSMSWCRRSLLIFSLLYQLNRLAPNFFRTRHVIALTILLASGDLFLGMNISYFPWKLPLFNLLMILVILAEFGFLLIWLNLYRKWYSYYHSVNTSILPPHIHICNICATALTFYTTSNTAIDIFAILMGHSHCGWSMFGPYYHTSITIFFTATIFFTTAFILRRTRQQSRLIEQSLEARKSFMRYISHEIRTPLNIVMAGLKVLEEDVQEHASVEDLEETLLDIRSSCLVAIETLSEMLTFDKVETNSMTLDLSAFRVHRFITDCLRPFYLQATAKGVVMSVHYSEQEAHRHTRMRADQHKLSQVLRNLVSNALKFTPKDGHVNIYVKHETGNLKIEVVDTGAGIAKENQEKLFKQIVQFHPGRLQGGGGTGLGLFISKGIVDLHGGDLAVFSAGEGTGTKFTLKVPLNTPLEGSIYSIPEGYVSHVSENSTDSSLPQLPISVSLYDRNHQDIVQSFRAGSTLSRRQAGKSVGLGIGMRNPRLFEVSSASFPSQRRHTCALTTNEPVKLLAERSLGRNEISPKPLAILQHTVPRIYPTSKGMSLPKKLRLLLVDDSEANRKMLNRLLRNRCDVVETADDGAVAVEKVKSLLESNTGSVYDVVLMDNHMVNMDGPAAAQEMRKLGFNGLIIGLTGDAAEEDVKDFMSHGADYVLTKPLDMKLFDNVLMKF